MSQKKLPFPPIEYINRICLLNFYGGLIGCYNTLDDAVKSQINFPNSIIYFPREEGELPGWV